MSISRYQQDVAVLDGRRRWKMRVAGVVGAALVAIAALWSAGLPPSTWFARMHADSQSRTDDSVSPNASQLPEVATPASITTVQAAFPGVESSTASEPTRLILTGTQVGRNSREGTAFIGVNATNPQTYAAGALLANGARLSEIYETYVVLERDGKAAWLYLQDAKGQGVNKRDAQVLLMVGGHSSATAAVATSTEAFTDFIRPSPIYDGDVLRGYEVYAGKNSAVFSKWGLQAGDVITSLNGALLTDPEQAMEMFRQLTTGTAVTATVRRKSGTVRLSLDGSSIASEIERNRQSTTAVASNPETAPPM